MKLERINYYARLSVFALFLVFIVSMSVTVLYGTKIRNDIESYSGFSYNDSICLSFLSEKLRQCNDSSLIYISDFSGQTSLCIDSKSEGILYTDILYSYDGWLYELMCKKNMNFSPSDGTRIVQIGSVNFSEPKPGLIQILEIDNKGKQSNLNIFLRSGVET